MYRTIVQIIWEVRIIEGQIIRVTLSCMAVADPRRANPAPPKGPDSFILTL